MQTLATKETHRDFIDGLRGLAILMVMANHWYYYGLKVAGENWLTGFAQRCIEGGATGVVLFFLVSSFTLFLSSHRRFKEEATPIRNFYIRRAFRILPLWWLAVIAFSAYHALPLIKHWCCFSMVFGFTLGNDHPVIGAWSLFVEESFYLVFPLIMFRLTDLRKAVLFTVAMFAVRAIWVRGGYLAFFPAYNPLIHFFPLAHWYAFGLGICLYFIHEQPLLKKVWDDIRWARLFDGLALILMFRFWAIQPWGAGDDLSALALSIFFVAAMFPKSLIGRFTRLKIMRELGICCYSLYLFHGLFILAIHPYLSQVMTTWPVELKFLVTFPFAVLVLLALAKVSFRYFERPAVDLGKKLISSLGRRHALSA